MTFDPWRILRTLNRSQLATLAFLLVAVPGLALFAWLAPDLLGPSVLPIFLLAGVAAYVSWRWSREHL